MPLRYKVKLTVVNWNYGVMVCPALCLSIGRIWEKS